MGGSMWNVGCGWLVGWLVGCLFPLTTHSCLKRTPGSLRCGGVQEASSPVGGEEDASDERASARKKYVARGGVTCDPKSHMLEVEWLSSIFKLIYDP